jgi:hypothetical protein
MNLAANTYMLGSDTLLNTECCREGLSLWVTSKG